MSLRGCMEVCCSPNTVSKFIRFFPKFAALFIILHIILLILTSLNKTHEKTTNTAEPNSDLLKQLNNMIKKEADVSNVISIKADKSLSYMVKDPRLRNKQKT